MVGQRVNPARFDEPVEPVAPANASVADEAIASPGPIVPAAPQPDAAPRAAAFGVAGAVDSAYKIAGGGPDKGLLGQNPNDTGLSDYVSDVGAEAAQTFEGGKERAGQGLAQITGSEAEATDIAGNKIDTSNPVERAKQIISGVANVALGGAQATGGVLAAPVTFAAGETSLTALEVAAHTDPAGSGVIFQSYNDILMGQGLDRNTAGPRSRFDAFQKSLIAAFDSGDTAQQSAAALYMALNGLIEFTASGGVNAAAGGVKMTARGLQLLRELRAGRAAAGALEESGGLAARVGEGPTGVSARVMGAKAPETGGSVGDLQTHPQTNIAFPDGHPDDPRLALDRVNQLRQALVGPKLPEFATAEGGSLDPARFRAVLQSAIAKIAKKQPLSPEEEDAYSQVTKAFQPEATPLTGRPPSGGFKAKALQDVDASKLSRVAQESGYPGLNKQFFDDLKAGKLNDRIPNDVLQKFRAADLEMRGYDPNEAARVVGYEKTPAPESPGGPLGRRIAEREQPVVSPVEEISRKIEARAKAENRPLTPREEASIEAARTPSPEANQRLIDATASENQAALDAARRPESTVREAKTAPKPEAPKPQAGKAVGSTRGTVGQERAAGKLGGDTSQGGMRQGPPITTPRAPASTGGAPEGPEAVGRMPGDVGQVRQPMLKTSIEKSGQARLAPDFEAPSRGTRTAFPEAPLKGGTAMGRKLSPDVEELGKQLKLADAERAQQSLSSVEKPQLDRVKQYVRAQRGIGQQEPKVLDGLVNEFGIPQQLAAKVMKIVSDDSEAARQGQSKAEKVLRAIGAYKVTRAAGDISFTLRQARKFISHGKVFTEGLKAEAEALKGDGSFTDRMSGLYDRLVRGGWDKTDLFWATTRSESAIARVAESEESAALGGQQIVDMISGRIPGGGKVAELYGTVIDRTNDAAAAMANVVRGETALGWQEVMSKVGVPFGEDDMNSLARVLNAASLRGFKPPQAITARLGMAVLNATVFSPQANAGRIRFYAQAVKAAVVIARSTPEALTHLKEGNPLLRSGVKPHEIEALRLGLTDIATTTVLTAAAAKVLGIESVDFDPASTNFLRADLGPAGAAPGLVTAAAELFGMGTQQYGGRNYIDLSNGAGADMRTLWRLVTGDYRTTGKSENIRWDPSTPVLGDIQRLMSGDTRDTEKKLRPYESTKNDVLDRYVDGKLDIVGKLIWSKGKDSFDITMLPIFMWLTNTFQAATGIGNEDKSGGPTGTRAPILQNGKPKATPTPR